MTENGAIREDLALPSGTEEYDKLAQTLKQEMADQKDILVTVLKVREEACWRAAAAVRCVARAGGRFARMRLRTRALPACTRAQAMGTEMINSYKCVAAGK